MSLSIHPRLQPFSHFLPHLIILVLGVYIASRVVPLDEWLTSDMFPRSRHAYRYPYLMEQFSASFLAGNWYPRWAPDLLGGYGYPTFMYYPAGYWFLMLPLMLATGNVLLTHYVSLAVLAYIGGLGMYKLARLNSNAGWAMVCAILFLLAPNFLKELYQGSLAQFTGSVWTPWVFYFLLRLHQTLDSKQFIKPMVGLVVSATAIIYAHHFAAFWCALVCAVVIGILFAQTQHRRLFALLLLQAFLYVALLSAPYWFGLVMHLDDVFYQRSVPRRLWGSIQPHLLYAKVVEGRLGLIQSVLALLSFVMSVRYFRSHAIPIALGVLVIGICVINTPLGAYVWKELPFLYFVQRPYRVFMLMLILVIWMISYLHPYAFIKRYRWSSRMQVVLLCVIIASVLSASILQRDLPKIKLRSYETFAHNARNSWNDMQHSGEFTPRTARRLKKTLPIRAVDEPLMQAGCSGAMELSVDQTGEPHVMQGVVNVTHSTPQNRACIIINQLYMPGWRAQVNGVDMMPSTDHLKDSAYMQHDVAGRINVFLPTPGTYKVSAWFEGPLYWLERNILMGIGLLLCLGWTRATYRKKELG